MCPRESNPEPLFFHFYIYIYIYLANLSGFGIMQLPDEF